MNIIKSSLAIALCTVMMFSCKKNSEPSDPACETNNTTKVTFKNTTTTSKRLEVAKTFNSEFVPNEPVLSIDLAPGASISKEFRYGKYFVQWKNGCPSACSKAAFYAKDYLSCQEYNENL